MLKEIDIVPREASDIYSANAASEDAAWIIKKDQLAATRQARDMVLDAQTRADALLSQARSQAQEYCEAGMRKGVEMGVQAALHPLVTLLEELQHLKEDLRVQASLDAQFAMQDFMAEAPTLVTLLDTVLASHLSTVTSPLRITVPTKADVSALSAHCRHLGLDARIDVSQTDCVFSASWDVHRWEVHVDSLYGPLRVGEVGSQALPISDELAREMCRDALIKFSEQWVARI